MVAWGNVMGATMRLLLTLLLSLSLPAYAALWNLESTFTEEGGITLHLVGFFTVANNKITDYNIQMNNGRDTHPWFPNGCVPGSDFVCNKAEVIDPSHLHFFYSVSPASTTFLDLFLSAPIDSGQDPIQLLPTTDFAANYGLYHATFVSGSITDPLVVPEPSIPGILGIGLLAWMTRRALWASKRSCIDASQGQASDSLSNHLPSTC